jgi:hypothetical protein
MWFKTRRIFISHSSKDDNLANALVEQLASRGLKPFVDHHAKSGIIPGSDWLQALRRDLGGAQAVLILVSDDWRLSQWCQAEFRTAKLLNKPIIPVVVGSGAHADIEPSLQKIVVEQDATDIPRASIDAIDRALPSRVFANTVLSTGIAAVLLIAAMGLGTTQYGRWDAAHLKGGAFVDLLAGQNGGLLALGVNTWGRRGLYASADCGSTWSEMDLPDELADPNRLDDTIHEILVATDRGLWIYDKATRKWSRFKLEGLSDTVLVAKVVPGQPDRVIYGTRKPGGVSVFAGTAIVGGQGGQLQLREGMGGTTILDRRSRKIRSFPFQMNDVAFHPQDPGKIAVAAANDGVFVSQDGLATAIRITNIKLAVPLFVSFDSTGETVYAGGRSGLSSFTFPTSPEKQPEVRHHAGVTTRTTHGLTLGTDGRMLLATTTGLFVAERRDTKFAAFAPAPLEKHTNKVLQCGDRTLIATGGAGVLSFSKDTQAWHPVLTSSSNIDAFTGISAGSLHVVSAGPYIFRSLDGGQTFEMVLAPGANATTLSAREPALQNGSATAETLRRRSEAARSSYRYNQSSILAGLGNGKIFRKPSGSVEWAEIRVAEASSSTWPVNAIVRSTTHPHVVLAAFRDRAPLLSADDGETWAALDRISPEHAVSAFALEDGRFLLGALDGRLRAFDPGNKDVVIGSSAARSPISGYAFDPARSLSLAVDFGGNVYQVEPSSLRLIRIGKVRTDAATDWIDLFCCDSAGRFYLGGKSMGLLRSGDGGKAWERVESIGHDTTIYALGPGPMGRPSIYSAAGLLRASDQGKVCMTDTYCLCWSLGKISLRVSTLWKRLRQSTTKSGPVRPTPANAGED